MTILQKIQHVINEFRAEHNRVPYSVALSVGDAFTLIEEIEDSRFTRGETNNIHELLITRDIKSLYKMFTDMTCFGVPIVLFEVTLSEG